MHPFWRPIISGNGSLTENLSKFIDGHLRPHVLTIPSYVKDTIHLLRQLDGLQVPPNSILVAIDVEALYSSIPHKLGLACKRRVLSEKSGLEEKVNDYIVEALDFVLNHNYFAFNGSHFLQVEGVAMVTCCAPAYANMYLGEWERMIDRSEDMIPFMDHVIVWFHYIDDIFIIWSGPDGLLSDFCAENE